MIRHIVLVKFRHDTSADGIAAILDGVSALVAALPGAHGFTGGRSESPEAMERGYLHGFVIDFDTWADLQRYADHPDHGALGARIIARAAGGRDGILVVDLDLVA